MRLLELFSGTHSIGVVAEKMGIDVVSLERDIGAKSTFNDYTSKTHIKEDIMTWDYKKDYKPGDFDIVTASPVCLFWSRLINTLIGRKIKSINPDGSIVTKQDLQRDIDNIGKPMVDKCFEIIEYFRLTVTNNSIRFFVGTYLLEFIRIFKLNRSIHMIGSNN